MSGVKNIIQQDNKGLGVPTNDEYRKVGTGSAEAEMKSTSSSAGSEKGK